LSDVGQGIRKLLARILDVPRADALALADDTPLFGSGLSLDSVTGLELLTGIKSEFGVDIAAEDLNLDSLQTVGTLVDYVSAHSDSSQTSR
jgi:acyl carrier protein